MSIAEVAIAKHKAPETRVKTIVLEKMERKHWTIKGERNRGEGREKGREGGKQLNWMFNAHSAFNATQSERETRKMGERERKKKTEQ